MKYLILIFKLIVFTYLIYLLIFLVSDYDPSSSVYHPPFAIWIIDIINLYIHEAGHFFFKIFGRWMYFLGGSLFQCIVPFTLVIVAAKQNFTNASFAGFWLGESVINVSIYVKDAPFQKLHLISKGLIHDWHWLLSSNLDAAEPLGNILFIVGIIICIVSIVVGIISLLSNFKRYAEPKYSD